MTKNRLACGLSAFGLMAGMGAQLFMPMAAYAESPVACSADGEATTCAASSSEELKLGINNVNVSEIVIAADIADVESMTISRGITINGNGNKLTSVPNAEIEMFTVETSEPVEIRKLSIDTTYRAVGINNTAAKLTIDDVSILAYWRGVSVLGDGMTEGYLTITDSSFRLNPTVLGSSDYETAAYSGQYPGMKYDEVRGISLYGVKGAKIIIENTEVLGFWTAINMNGGDMAGTVINVTNCYLAGRSGMNIYANNPVINVNGGHIHGVHTFPGATESFADIVLNTETSGVELNIDGTLFTNYLSEAALNDESTFMHGGSEHPNSAMQYMIGKRDYKWLFDESYVKNVVNIFGDTRFVDYAKNKSVRAKSTIEPIYCSGYEVEQVEDSETIITACPEVNIYGGVYPYDDVKLFVDYEKDDVYYIEADDVYVVAPKTTYTLGTNKVTVKYGQPAHVEVSITPAKVGGYDNPNLDYTVASNNEVISFDKTTGLVSTTSTKETSGVLTFTFADKSEKTVAVSVEGLKADVEEDEEIPSEDEAASVQKDAQEVIDSIIDGEAVDSFEYAEGVDAEEVLTAVAAGDDFGTVLNADEISAEDVDVEAADAIDDEMREGAKLAGYFDVNVALVNLTQDKTVGYLTELSGEVTVTIPVPEDVEPVKEGFERSYYVIRYHDDTAETLDTTNNSDGTISFKSSKFSTYALTYVDSEKKADATAPNTGVFTGAGSVNGGVIAVAVLVGIVTAAYAARRLVLKRK